MCCCRRCTTHWVMHFHCALATLLFSRISPSNRSLASPQQNRKKKNKIRRTNHDFVLIHSSLCRSPATSNGVSFMQVFCFVSFLGWIFRARLIFAVFIFKFPMRTAPLAMGSPIECIEISESNKFHIDVLSHGTATKRMRIVAKCNAQRTHVVRSTQYS